MPTFSHVEVHGGDTALIDAIYQLGVDNPIPPDYACSPIPHMLRADIQAAADDPNIHVLAVYDGAELRSVVAFTSDGTTTFGFSKGYGDGKALHPNGRAMMQYQYGVVKAMAGRARTINKNPGAQAFYRQFGIETQ